MGFVPASILGQWWRPSLKDETSDDAMTTGTAGRAGDALISFPRLFPPRAPCLLCSKNVQGIVNGLVRDLFIAKPDGEAQAPSGRPRPPCRGF